MVILETAATLGQNLNLADRQAGEIVVAEKRVAYVPERRLSDAQLMPPVLRVAAKDAILQISTTPLQTTATV